MIKGIVFFVLGIVASALFIEERRLHDESLQIDARWHNFERISQTQLVAVHSFLEALRSSPYEMSEVYGFIANDLEVVGGNSQTARRTAAAFENYDHSQLKLSKDLNELARILRADPGFVSQHQLSPILSRIEGTQSAAARAEYDFDEAVGKFRIDSSGLFGNLLTSIRDSSSRLNEFEVFAESGPVTSSDGVDDDD